MEVTDEQVTVNVQAENPSGASSVHGRYREMASTSWAGLGSLSISTGTASFGIPTADLEAGAEYSVQVSLDSGYPEGDRTASATFTTPEAPQPTVTLVNVSDIARTSAQVTVFTSDAEAGTRVHLQIYSIGTGWLDSNGNLIVQDDGFARHSLTGLSAGTLYRFRASFDDSFPRDATKTAIIITDPLPILGGISVEEITGSSATVTVTVDNFDPELDAIHLRYGEDERALGVAQRAGARRRDIPAQRVEGQHGLHRAGVAGRRLHGGPGGRIHDVPGRARPPCKRENHRRGRRLARGGVGCPAVGRRIRNHRLPGAVEVRRRGV